MPWSTHSCTPVDVFMPPTELPEANCNPLSVIVQKSWNLHCIPSFLDFLRKGSVSTSHCKSV
ncbi:unnamed protein product [Acanthoscelides obtectus]|uniref:Uncharacterized protein n=1 Tax=Acanthoscelides obtectus TaxID=200917 RepID=A0A9P0KBP2_ACAOB|nr:unnamed protein product [Acanthoscelides obtectus]CAK1649317.1 hypothetical protein AOBTE_LOCUS16153 [Acanthoscelides obtectus]